MGFNRPLVCPISWCAQCVSCLSRPPDVKIGGLMENQSSIPSTRREREKRWLMWKGMPNFVTGTKSAEGVLRDTCVCQRFFRCTRWFSFELKIARPVQDTHTQVHMHTLGCKVEQSDEWPTVSSLSCHCLQLFHQSLTSGSPLCACLTRLLAHA